MNNTLLHTDYAIYLPAPSGNVWPFVLPANHRPHTRLHAEFEKRVFSQTRRPTIPEKLGIEPHADRHL